MVKAICREIELRADFFEAESQIETIYFGGGTPSVLDGKELEQIMKAITQRFSISPNPEITLEANPDDLSAEKAKELQKAGINRLSIGVQSFREKDLKWMNRSHSVSQILDSIQFARGSGIENFSVDLIFGLPDLSNGEWRSHLNRAIELEIPHVSVYSLTVEEKTALAHQLSHDLVQLPGDEQYMEQFLAAHQVLTDAGYDHYELSNYAQPNRYSRHNSSYWEQVPYLGLGPSAHSFDGIKRYWNLSNNHHYLKALASGKTAVEASEWLTKQDRYHEYLITQLRKKTGINPEWITSNLIPDWQNKFGKTIRKLEAEGKLILKNNNWCLPVENWMISDQIIREFFLE